jgi:anti-anti-sigma factor
MPAPSILCEQTKQGTVVLSVQRGLKGEGETALRQRIDELVRAGHRDIVIDLEPMPFVDSSELGRLIRSHLSVRQAGGRVRLCNLAPRVAALMKLTKLDTVLDVYNSVDEALTEIHRNREQQPRAAP